MQTKSLPGIEIIWLPDAAIKESKERLRATFRNVGIILPNKRFVLNLSPSDIRKVGTSFDLSMAVAILVLLQEWRVHHQKDLEKYLFFGELGLDGTIKEWVTTSSVISAIKNDTRFFVPSEFIWLSIFRGVLFILWIIFTISLIFRRLKKIYSVFLNQKM